MPRLSEIDKYHKLGRGGMFQFYITDEELQNILANDLLKEYEPYSLISNHYDGKETFYFKEMELSAFSSYRIQKYHRFYLKSLRLSPQLDFPTEPITGGRLRSDYEKYYLYNGLIDIQHGFLLSHKYFSESRIGLIEKYYDERKPDDVYGNKEYLHIFKDLKSKIKKLLKHKSKQIMTDGSTMISTTNNVSEGFATAVNTEKIITDIQIV